MRRTTGKRSPEDGPKALLAAAPLAIAGPAAAEVADGLTPAEAQAIARDAYYYAFPIVLMDITMRQSTNVPDATSVLMRAPLGQFAHVRSFPPADARDVVRINFDTLYSFAWIDLSAGPMVLSVPDSRRPLLPDADARHVDRRLRGPRLAHHPRRGARLRAGAAGLGGQAAGGADPDPRADADGLDPRPGADQRPGGLRRRARGPGRP